MGTSVCAISSSTVTTDSPFALSPCLKRICYKRVPCYVDLVFYNYFLKCFVLIDLKRDMVEYGDVGQMNMYLNYFKSEEGTPSDAAPIGIVLGAKKDDLVVQFAIEGITNRIFVSRYQLYLPDKEQLRRELAFAIESETRKGASK